MITTTLLNLLFSQFWFTAAIFPSQFQRCNRNQADYEFQNCLNQAVEDAIKNLKNVHPSYGLPRLEPFEIPKIEVTADLEDASYEGKFQDYKISGITESDYSTLVNMDFKNLELKLELFFPELGHTFNCCFNGSLMGQSISGLGLGNGSTINTKFTITFYLEEVYLEDETKIYELHGTVVELEVDLPVFNFEIYQGDISAENFTELVNENVDLFFSVIKDYYEFAIEEILSEAMLQFFKNVPADELFGANKNFSIGASDPMLKLASDHFLSRPATTEQFLLFPFVQLYFRLRTGLVMSGLRVVESEV